MSAKATGADPSSSSSAKNRDHNQGQQNREFTPAQKAAVDRVRKCKHTAYYEILDIKVEATDAEVKKAYRKLALTMHPDKNGAPGADEAFKLISKAFQVLSDSQKRAHFDRTGGDPEVRGGFPGAGAAGGGPFGGFAGTPGRGGRYGEGEISPEDLFNMFFGGNAFGGGGGPFGQGGTFFDFGGGPGIRIHQFGGQRPQRRRPRNPNDPEPEPEERSFQSTFTQLLPLIVLFIFPLLSSLFSLGTSSSETASAKGPTIKFDFTPPHYTHKRVSAKYKIPYFLNPTEVSNWDDSKLKKLDKRAEQNYLHVLRVSCQFEHEKKQTELQESQGWFFIDQDRAKKAMEMQTPSCDRLHDLGFRIQ